jgi:hypothetical protein
MKKLLSIIFLSIITFLILTSCGDINDISGGIYEPPITELDIETEEGSFNFQLPEMIIKYYLSDKKHEVLAKQGVSNWSTMMEDGTLLTQLSDSAHPVQIILSLPTVDRATDDIILNLLFNDAPTPTSIKARRWNVNNIEKAVAYNSYDIDFDNYENVELINGNITIPYSNNEYVYEVTVVWLIGDIENFANYSFYVSNPKTHGVNNIESSGYIALSYRGVMPGIQESVALYDVWNDQDFVDKVWSVLNHEAWTEFDIDYEPFSQKFIFLTFHTGIASPLKFTIASNDIGSNEFGWLGLENHDDFEVIYYNLPPGTFYNLYNMLTDYSYRHTVTEINIESIRNISRSGGIMRFITSDEPVTFVNLLTKDAGDFVADWELELWEQYKFSDELMNILDSSNPSREVIIVNGASFEGTVGIDRVVFASNIIDGVHLAGISTWAGVNLWYRIPKHIYNLIQEQFIIFNEKSTLEEQIVVFW